MISENQQFISGAENVIWDLTDLYPSAVSKEFLADLNGLNERCADFKSRWKGKVATLTPPQFFEALSEYEGIHEAFDRIMSFAHLQWTTQTTNPEAGKSLQTAREVASTASMNLVFFMVETGRLSAEQHAIIAGAPELQKYKHWFDNIRSFQQYQLSEEVEEVLSVTGLTSRSAWVRFFDQVSNEQVYVMDGKEFTGPQIFTMLHDNDRSARESVARTISEGLKNNASTNAYIFNTVIADHATQMKLRKFPTWLSERNLSNEVTDQGALSLIHAVESRYSTVQRLFELKRNILGYDKFYDYDRYAPVIAASRLWTWAEAKEIVVNAYMSFHPKMGEIVEMFFDKNWIHAPVIKGKSSGAFSASTAASAHPYIFMNFTGTARDVQTLAHELGHGVHQYLSRKHGSLLMHTPLTVAETASVFGEIITFNSLFDKETDNSARLGMLVEKLTDMTNTVFRQIALNRFEDAIHTTRRSQGELSVDTLCDLWMQTQRDQFGESVTLTEGYQYWWSYISHFIHTPGYVYAYAYGELLVLALYEKYKKNRSGFPELYFTMLEAGGSKSPRELMEPFGINVEDPAFWNTGLDVMDRGLREAEELFAALTGISTAQT